MTPTDQFRRLRSMTVIGTVLLIALAALPARAAEIKIEQDPNDTAGKLDIRTIGVQRKNNGNLFVGIRMFSALEAATLDADGSNRIIFYFNINSSNQAEYVGTIASVNGEMFMSVEGKGDPFDPIPVTQVDSETIKVRLPEDFPANTDQVKLFAKSRLTGSGACSDTCVDRAPDGGSIAP